MAAPTPSHPAIYTASQLRQYFARIALPVTVQDELLELSDSSVEHDQDSERRLALLTTLQQHQLAHVPFENLSLHYSPHRTIALDAASLYGKIVERRRGGYCMENNCFFGAVLRGLGFSVCSVGGRVSHAISGEGVAGGYNGWYVFVCIFF